MFLCIREARAELRGSLATKLCGNKMEVVGLHGTYGYMLRLLISYSHAGLYLLPSPPSLHLSSPFFPPSSPSSPIRWCGLTLLMWAVQQQHVLAFQDSLYEIQPSLCVTMDQSKITAISIMYLQHDEPICVLSEPEARL